MLDHRTWPLKYILYFSQWPGLLLDSCLLIYSTDFINSMCNPVLVLMLLSICCILNTYFILIAAI